MSQFSCTFDKDIWEHPCTWRNSLLSCDFDQLLCRRSRKLQKNLHAGPTTRYWYTYAGPQPGTNILIQAHNQVLIYFYRLAKPRRLLPRSSEPCSPAQSRARSSTQSKLQPCQLHRLPDPQRLSSRTWLYRLLYRSKHSEDRVPLV